MDIPKKDKLLRQGSFSHTEGFGTTANSFGSHAEGVFTIAGLSENVGVAAHAEGLQTLAQNNGTHAEGYLTNAGGIVSHAEGHATSAPGYAAHAEGYQPVASGFAAHAQGGITTASGNYAHAEGFASIASGEASHAEGTFDEVTPANITKALARGSHAEGIGTTAGVNNTTGLGAHAEGVLTTASGQAAHAEGLDTSANGISSHAEGASTTASANTSHAEGFSTMASGFASHAEGQGTIASGINSHAEGEETSTAGFLNAHIMGRFGDANEADSWFIGNGASSVARGIGAKWSGSTFNMSIDGATYITGGADYAEMFETADGNPIDVGYFVTAAEGKKIRKATANDHFILGITSATPSVRGNSADLSWQGKYFTDEWGRKKYHEVTIPAKKDKEGNITIPERTEIQPMLNPDWKPSEQYVPRINRPEWAAVGLIGQILVRDDGTCETHGYCLPNDDGIATKAENGYFVLERTGDHQVLVLFYPIGKI